MPEVLRDFGRMRELGHARLRTVAYHEAFWVVMGTSAPVIGLAAVVSYNQSSAAFNWSKRQRRLGVPGARRNYQLAVVTGWMVITCLSFEFVVFGTALIALASGTDLHLVEAATIVTLVGWWLFVPAGLVAFKLHERRLRTEQRRTGPEEPRRDDMAGRS